MFRLRMLGGLALERGGAPYVGPASQRRRLALLALAASADALGVAREKLAAYLWPESDSSRARHSIDDALSALRRELGGESLFLGVASLRLNPDVIATDLAEVASALRGGDLERAASLYGGPFLDGFSLPNAPEFERWVDAERARHARTQARTLETLATTARARNDLAAAVRWWRELVVMDPASTNGTLALVDALGAAGDRAEALRVLRVHEALLRDELGAAPDPRIAAAARALRASPAPTPHAQEPIAQEPTTREPIAREPTPAAVPDVRPAEAPPEVTAVATAPALRRWSRSAAAREVADRPRWRRVIAVGAIATASVALVAALIARRPAPSPFDDGALDPRRVAVIPFENATGDPRFDALGAMVADMTTQAIAQSGVLRVVSSPSALVPTAPTGYAAGAASRESAAQIGRRLGAGTVVSGSIYRAGDSLRFQTQLTDVARGEIASMLPPVVGPAARPGEAADAVPDRVLASLAALTDERLATWARVAGPPPSYDAYREFVAGRAAWPDYEVALAHFQRSAALDSTYDLALLEMATAYRMLGQCERTDSVGRIVFSHGRQLARFDRLFMEQQLASCTGDLVTAYQRAIELRRLAPASLWMAYDVLLQANDINRPHEALAAIDGLDLERGAAEVGPTFYMNVALVLHRLGRHDRELDVANLGCRLFPSSPTTLGARVRALGALGRAREAFAALDSLPALETRPAAPRNGSRAATLLAQELRTHGHSDVVDDALRRSFAELAAVPAAERTSPAYLSDLARVQYAAGRWREAEGTISTLLARDSANLHYHGGLGVVAARLGDRATAQAQDAWLARVRGPYESQPVVWRMRIAALLGERERAVALAREAVARNGFGHTMWLLHLRLDLDSLRGYPPFEELVRPKG